MVKVIIKQTIYWVIHITQKHIKGGEIFSYCWMCWLYYSGLSLVVVWISWKLKNKHMSETLQWVLIFIAIATPPIIVALINYFAYKRKIRAEAENIETKTKIAKEITYDQIKTENKQKEIKGKIEILTQLTRLEKEIK